MDSDFGIEKLIGPILDGMDLKIVESSIGRHRGDIKVNLVLYKDGGISLDDLTAAQKTLRPRLELEFDREDLSVEISSPGMSRVIKNPIEYGIFTGREVKILVEDDWTTGTIQECDGKMLTLTVDGAQQVFPLKTIRKGKLA